MLNNKNKIYHNFSYSLSESFFNSKKSICLIVKDNKEAVYLKNELKFLIAEKDIKLFPENDILPYDHFSVPKSINKQRFEIINKDTDSKHILITSIKNLFDKYPIKENFQSKNSFNVGSNLSINNLIKIVTSLNYNKMDNVENINEYTCRGGIIDIFTPIYKNPLRIEIFDDVIESIRFFNKDTQLSINTAQNFMLTKGDIISLDQLTIDLFIDKWREYFNEFDERYCSIFQNIKNQETTEGIEIYFPFFFKETSSFFDLFSDYEYLRFEDLTDDVDKYEQFINSRFNDETNEIDRPLINPNDFYTSSLEIINHIKKTELIKPSSFNCLYENSDQLVENYNKHISSDVKYILMTSISSELDKLKNNTSFNIPVITDINKMKGSFNLMFGPIVRTMFLEDKNILIMHKENLNNLIKAESDDINEARYIDYDQSFKKNEYIIHEDYGLGIYSGLEIVKANMKKNEYIKIMYAENENLYVPLNNINKITSYHKQDILKPLELDSLSSKKWSVKKDKAIKKSIDHAAEILDIESRRLKSFSQSLKIDNQNLSLFQDDFPYNETPDQISAFNDIRKDLSLIKPMNRVLCGDVGFGKTEVAMKSAFIAVNSNKQTIVITPSTILSDQHYNSFLERFSNFGVRIEKLNRFVTKDKRNQILNDFECNKIDILITTHIVFNNDISFKHTGLLIIDEEHKFGIKQKNFIKNKQENIHILYLSATPIPRTMNMIFSGLKDFSFLQTAPSNRVNIKSFLKVQTNQLIKESLVREKLRNGQSFIIQNNIEKIQQIKKDINYLLPDYKIGIAHGKLNKKDIKNVMRDFKTGLLDGLICTTIVEMGLDIPNANTMIIINSQNFGLSQLHQLRGRIGRSNKQGYCYFLIPDIEIPKIARTRLDSIIKNSNLGEGFLIAQEDLEIRGGGEMLGDKQSGHVNNVGMSLYLSMLKKAIDASSKKTNEPSIKPDINFNDSSYIDSSYLPSPVERLKIYRKIEAALTIDEIERIRINLTDRCGVMPLEVTNILIIER